MGTCLDDSIGEAFDKVCRMLKLPWLPGISGGPGAALEELAKKGNPKKFALPIPMQRQMESIDFSFAGLKSAVLKWFLFSSHSLSLFHWLIDNHVFSC